MMITYYGNVLNTQEKDAENKPIDDIIKTIQSGSLKPKIDQIRACERQIKKQRDEEEQKKWEEKKSTLKRSLPIAMFNGIFTKRSGEGLQEPTNLVTIDIDDITQDEVDAKKQELQDDPYCLVVFKSPSNKLKAIFKAQDIKDSNDYLHAWEYVRRYLKEHHSVEADQAANDISRATFLSHDPDAHYNPQAEAFPWGYLPDIKQKEPSERKGWYVCPFHDDQNPSMVIYDDGGWYCYGCNNSGTADTYYIDENGKAHAQEDARPWKMNSQGGHHYLYLPEGNVQNCMASIRSIRENEDLAAKRKEDLISEEIYKFIRVNETIISFNSDEKEEFWYYHKGVYKPNGKLRIEAWVRSFMGDSYKMLMVNRVANKLRADQGVDGEEFHNQPTEHPENLCVRNGILNLRTLELKPHTPHEVHFSKVDVDYDPTATAPEFLKFFNEITPDPNTKEVTKESNDEVRLVKSETRRVIQEFLGSILLKDVRFERAIILYGERGRNGKGKLLSYFQTMLGGQNCTNMKIKQMEENSFSKGHLHGSLVNIVGEFEEDAPRNLSLLKELIGQDQIEAEQKYKPNIKFTPYANLLFACNKIPLIFGKGHGAFWSRWVLSEFPYEFKPPQEYDENNPYHKKQDPMLIKRLIKKGKEGEFSGVLNWMIEGLHRAMSHKGYTSEMDNKKIKMYWETHSSSIFQFLHEMVKRSPYGEITKEEFRDKFQDFCIRRDIPGVSDKFIKPAIQEFGGRASKTFRAIGDGGYYERDQVWKGIEWKDIRHGQVEEASEEDIED